MNYSMIGSPFWNWFLTSISGPASGIYGGLYETTGKTKVGNSIDCNVRTKEQSLKVGAMIMTLEEIEHAIGDEFINDVIDIGLPALQYHTDRREELVRTICLYVGEGIVGSGYHNNSNKFWEKLTQIPSHAVRECINVDCMVLCAEYANNHYCPLPNGLQRYEQHIEFHANVRNGSVPQIFSWQTTKNLNHDYNSDFMKARQRSPPKDGSFLKNKLAMQRCGSTYAGYKDAVTTCPASKFIDKHCLENLQPLLKDDEKDQEAIRAAIDPITRKNWDQYLHPSEVELADGTKQLLEDAIDNWDERNSDMIQTQCNNFDALQMVHPKWVDDTFDMNDVLEYGRSKFIKTKDGRIRMGVHSAHYLIFATGILLKVRFALAKDYCFHLDMILANGYLTLEEVDGTRKIFQAYLMNLTYDDVVIATDDELRKFEGKEIDDEDGDDIVYDSEDENEDADDNNRNNNKGSSSSNKNII